MPIYEYTCRSCRKDFEALMPASRRDSDETMCPSCGAPRVARKISLMANPVVKGASSASGSSAEAFSCGAPSCCGGGCAIN